MVFTRLGYKEISRILAILWRISFHLQVAPLHSRTISPVIASHLADIKGGSEQGRRSVSTIADK